MPEGEALLDADLFRSFLYDGIEDIDEALSNFSDVAVAVADLNLAEGDRENLQGDIQPSLALVLLYLRDVESAEKDSSYQRKIAVSGLGRQEIRASGGQQYRSCRQYPAHHRQHQCHYYALRHLLASGGL